MKNWREYGQALQNRGSLTVWVTPEAIAAWHPSPTGKRGRAHRYSDLAIETGHLLRLAFGRVGRQTEGWLRSIADLPEPSTWLLAIVGLMAILPRKRLAFPNTSHATAGRKGAGPAGWTTF